jgi:hypothetical protein
LRTENRLIMCPGIENRPNRALVLRTDQTEPWK